MSGLDKVGQSIGKKLTLQDYSTVTHQDVNKITSNEVLMEKQHKVKVTVYLSEDGSKKLNEICSDNLLKNGKMDKSSLIERAIELLYEEKNNGK